MLRLPPPRKRSPVSVEEALRRRRSVRDFRDRPLTLASVGQLLWSAQGVTGREGARTAPSAGALFPLEVLLAAGRVEDLEAGLYRYRPASHALEIVAEGDRRGDLSDAALGQEYVREAPAVVILTAVVERLAIKYGSRAERYALLEAGHAAQNVYLQATALGLATVAVGAFEDHVVSRLLQLVPGELPCYLLPVGQPAR